MNAEIGGHLCPRTRASENRDRGHGRGNGHELFEKLRTRIRGGQASDMRVHRSLTEFTLLSYILVRTDMMLGL